MPRLMLKLVPINWWTIAVARRLTSIVILCRLNARPYQIPAALETRSLSFLEKLRVAAQ